MSLLMTKPQEEKSYNVSSHGHPTLSNQLRIQHVASNLSYRVSRAKVRDGFYPSDRYCLVSSLYAYTCPSENKIKVEKRLDISPIIKSLTLFHERAGLLT